MKTAAFWALLPSILAATAVFGAKFPLSQVPRVSKTPTVPNQFIIEVAQLSDIPTKRSFTRVRLLPFSFCFWLINRSYAQSLDAVYATLQERGVSFDVTKEFDSAGLFVGAAVTLNVRGAY